MVRYLAVAAVLLGAMSAREARADVMDEFTLQAGKYTVQFQLPASPVHPTTDTNCKVELPPEFCFTAVPVISKEFPGTFDIDFFDASNGGGIDLTRGDYDYFDKIGKQLYSGPVTAPTFLLGTFALTDYYNGTDATLMITQATPEPGTLGLLGTGVVGLVGVVRRRLG